MIKILSQYPLPNLLLLLPPWFSPTNNVATCRLPIIEISTTFDDRCCRSRRPLHVGVAFTTPHHHRSPYTDKD